MNAVVRLVEVDPDRVSNVGLAQIARISGEGLGRSARRGCREGLVGGGRSLPRTRLRQPNSSSGKAASIHACTAPPARAKGKATRRKASSRDLADRHPDTLLRCYRELVGQKYDGSTRSVPAAPGLPARFVISSSKWRSTIRAGATRIGGECRGGPRIPHGSVPTALFVEGST